MALPTVAPYAMPRPDELPRNRVPWTVDPRRAALLVHDLQNHFLRPYAVTEPPLPDLLAHTAALRDRCHAAGVPVLYSAQRGGQSPAERGLQQDFWGPGLPDDAAAVAFPAQVAPGAADVVLTKWKYSAFVRTDLARRLRDLGRDQLVLTGVYAHIGVAATACDAWMRDIQAFVAADAVAAFSARDHLGALHWAAGTCAVVATTADLLACLDADEDLTRKGA